MQTLAQNMMVMNVIPPASHSTSASYIHTGALTRFINMKNYAHVDFIVNMGTTLEATAQFSLYQAKAPGVSVTNSSISTTALSVQEYWTNKASVNGPFVRTAATSDIVAVDSTNSATYIVGINATALNGTSDYDCVGIGVVSATISTTCFFQVTAILSGARYEKDPLPTAKA